MDAATVTVERGTGMTNELAIKILTGDVLGTSEQTHEAVVMAVKALSLPSAQPEEPSYDAVKEYCRKRCLSIVNSALTGKYLPSAQRWIPCEERLPEPGVNVLVDVLDIPADDRFPLVDKIGDDGDWCNCYGEWLAVAWVPIPDPWEGENDG